MISIGDILAKRTSTGARAKPSSRTGRTAFRSQKTYSYPNQNNSQTSSTAQQTVSESKIPYSSANLRSKARIYAVIHDYLQIRFGHYKYKFFIKHLTKNKVIIDFQSQNNSLIASLNLNKVGLCGQFYELLKKEELINADTDLSLNLKLG